MNTPSLHHRKTRLTIAAAAVAMTSFVALPAAAAFAAPAADAPTSATAGASRFDTAKQRCADAVTKRQTTITKDLTRVEQATGAPAADRDTLTAQLQATASELAQRGDAIAAADTPDALRSACKGVASTTRLYVLDGPKVASVMATSWLAKADAHLAKANDADALAKVIERAEQRGVSAEAIADAKAKLADAKVALADAHTQIDGLTATLLPITPDQVNDHSAEATLTDARTRLHHALEDARRIRADLRGAAQDLRGE